jgi:hypothetical protein
MRNKITKKELVDRLYFLAEENNRLKAELKAVKKEFSDYQCMNENPFKGTGLKLMQLGAKMCLPDTHISELAGLSHDVGLKLEISMEPNES